MIGFTGFVSQIAMTKGMQKAPVFELFLKKWQGMDGMIGGIWSEMRDNMMILKILWRCNMKRERERLDLESLSYCGFGVSISGEVGDSFVDTAEPMSHFRLGMASPLLSCRCLELDEFRRCRRARIVSTSWNSSKHSNCRNLTNLVLQNIRCCKVCQDWFRFIPWCQVLEQFWWVWWHLGWLQICWSASQRPCCLGYKG